MDSLKAQLAEAVQLLAMARPLMEDKCSHDRWCIERRGILDAGPRDGWPELIDGMHPGCAPYRQWCDRVDALA